MRTAGRQRILWCVLFACVLSGPYLLGTYGKLDTLSDSGTYAVVAIGVLATMWASCYPGLAALFRRPAVWKACICASFLIVGLLLALGWFELAYRHVLDYPLLQAVFMSDMGMAREWVLALLGFAEAVCEHEKDLVFLASCLCGAASVGFVEECQTDCLAIRELRARRLVLMAVFFVGLLRAATWNLLLNAPWVILLIRVTILGWALCIVGRSDMRASIVALCMGELSFRVLCRLGLLFNGLGFEAFALVASVLCLGINVFAGARQASFGVADVRGVLGEKEATQTAIFEPWVTERLSEVSLTPREIDVLEASIDGSSSSEVAQRLEMQASTVRSYKGRICKKLDVESFDQLIAQYTTRSGLFAIVSDGGGTRSETPCSGEDAEDVPVHSKVAFALRFAGCMSVLILLLMPFGTLPSFWDATWVMAYACAVGIVVTCIVSAEGSKRMSKIMRWGHATAFALCAAACLTIRWIMESAGTGFDPTWQMALFFSVAGLVGFGVAEIRGLAGLEQVGGDVLAASSVYVALGVVVVVFVPGLWAAAVAVSLLLFIAGVVAGRKEMEQMGCVIDDAPAHTTSWFVLAFIWEECWRGVTYSSLQDIGILFLIGLVICDAVALFRQGREARLACIVVGCAVFACFAKGIVFGLLIGAIFLEVQVLHCTSAVRLEAGKAQKRTPLPPSLLGAAAGCCVAVYVVNTWGTYVLVYGNSILPTNLDWTSLGCFAASVAALLCRIFFGGPLSVSQIAPIDEARLKGYLIGKGLTGNEVKVCMALSRGDSAVQIAETLSYSLSAVGEMKRAAFSKLGITTRRQYMALLLREFDPKQGNQS